MDGKVLLGLKLALLAKIELALFHWTVLRAGGDQFLKKGTRTKNTTGFMSSSASLREVPAVDDMMVQEQYIRWLGQQDMLLTFIEEQRIDFKKKAEAVASELVTAATGAAKAVQHGGPNQGSWKQDVPPAATLEQIVSVAQKHLLKKEVATDITQAFSRLTKDSWSQWTPPDRNSSEVFSIFLLLVVMRTHC